MFKKRVRGIRIFENSSQYELTMEVEKWIKNYNTFKIIDIKFSSCELTTSCRGYVENGIKYQAMIIYS